MTINIEIKLSNMTNSGSSDPYITRQVNVVGAELISKITELINKQDYKSSGMSLKLDVSNR